MSIELRVASPCHEKWDTMQGDERVRRCAACQQNVFNVSELSEAEVLALVRQRTGRLCVRIYRRRDGTVLTRDCAVGLARVRRRVVLAVLAFVALLVAALGARSRPASCSTPNTASPTTPTERALTQARVWKETLRGTSTFGPIIEWFDPKRELVMGELQ